MLSPVVATLAAMSLGRQVGAENSDDPNLRTIGCASAAPLLDPAQGALCSQSVGNEISVVYTHDARGPLTRASSARSPTGARKLASKPSTCGTRKLRTDLGDCYRDDGQRDNGSQSYAFAFIWCYTAPTTGAKLEPYLCSASCAGYIDKLKC